jgi:hypothetical protein
MKLTSYLLLLLIITILRCSTVLAQQESRWVLIGQNTDGTSFYLDKTSRQIIGNKIRVWDKNIFQDGSYQIGLVEWQCKEKKYFLVDLTLYTPTGSFIRKEKGMGWLNVVPDAVSEVMYKAVCGTFSENNSKTKSSSKKMVQIIVRKANLRASPSTNSGIVQQANLGEKFSLVDEEPTNGWYQIIIARTNEIAWIHGNNIKLAEATNKSNSKKQKKKRQN